MAHIRPNAVVFIATEILADNRSALSAGFAFDTAVNAHLIRAGGLDIARDPVIGIVVETACTFHRSLTFPEVIDAGLRVTKLGGSSIGLHYRFLVGEELSLADLHAWPMVDDLLLTDAGADLVNGHAGVKAWAAMMAARPASRATAFPS